MKIKMSLFLFAFALVSGYHQNSEHTGSKIKNGMIKVAIFYPNGEDKTFDMDYYSDKHMPMAARLFGDNLKAMSIDKGLANAAPDQPVPYLAIGYFYFADMETMGKAMGTHSETLKADVSNYTNIRPELQISEVVRAE